MSCSNKNKLCLKVLNTGIEQATFLFEKLCDILSTSELCLLFSSFLSIFDALTLDVTCKCDRQDATSSECSLDRAGGRNHCEGRGGVWLKQ